MNVILYGIEFHHGCMGPLRYNPQRDLWWTVDPSNAYAPTTVDDIAPLFGKKGFNPYSSTHLYKVRDYMAKKGRYKTKFYVSSIMFQHTESGFFAKVDAGMSARAFCAPKKHRMFSKTRWSDPLGHFSIPHSTWKEGEYRDRMIERTLIDNIPVSFPDGYWSYHTENAYINAFEYVNAGWYFRRNNNDDDDDDDGCTANEKLGGLIKEADVAFLYQSPTTRDIKLIYVKAKVDMENDPGLLRIVVQPYILVNAKGNTKEDYLKSPITSECARDFGEINEPYDVLRIRNTIARMALQMVE